MKRVCLKSGGAIMMLLLTIAFTQVNAQQKKRNARANTKTTSKTAKDPFGGSTQQNTNPFGGTTSGNTTGTDPFGSGAASNNTSSANPFGAAQKDTTKKQRKDVPIVVVQSVSSNPLTDSTKASLRNENAIESSIKDRTPLQYDYIREDDALFREKIWRVIDAREKMNLPFRNPSTEDNGSQLFFAILYKAITEDSVVAFEDERFTIPYTKERFKAKFSGGLDTSDVMDLDGQTVLRREVRMKEFPVDSVYQFMVKEEMIFDKESSRMVTRIIGIAPMGPTILPSGKVIEGPASPYFWIYYPDIRSILAKYQVYNPKNLAGRQTWEDVFESRFFSSYIVKSTLNNFKNQSLKEYIKDPLFQLLEGEKIKEKIFNYEQDLWAY